MEANDPACCRVTRGTHLLSNPWNAPPVWMEANDPASRRSRSADGAYRCVTTFPVRVMVKTRVRVRTRVRTRVKVTVRVS